MKISREVCRGRGGGEWQCCKSCRAHKTNWCCWWQIKQLSENRKKKRDREKGMKKQQNRNEKLLQTKCTTAWRGRNGPAALPSPALPLNSLLTLTSPPSLAATSATGVDWHVRLPLVWHLPAQLGGHCTCLGCMTVPLPTPSPLCRFPPL